MKIKISSLALVMVLLATSVYAQTKRDAIELYNTALEEASAENYEAAISTFTQAITIADQLGAEGADIKNRSEKQIPAMYYKKALGIYNEYKQSRDFETLDAAIVAFRDASDVANEYSNDRIASTSRAVIPQLYYQKSILLYNENDFEAASEAVDKALEENSNYDLAYYQKAKIHKQINDTNNDGIIDEELDILLSWYDQAITHAETAGRQDVAERAREAAHDELVAVGTNYLQDDANEDAIELLSKALTYVQQSADAQYRLAEAHNKAGNHEEAITHARLSLEYENGGRTDKAKSYFEIGLANQMLGNKSEACDAFTNASFGSFKSNAEYKMEYELKCDSTAP